MNANALNAANALWGSLYDALYGTDVLEKTMAQKKQPAITRYAALRLLPMRASCWMHTRLNKGLGFCALSIENGRLIIQTEQGATHLADEHQFAGFAGSGRAPGSVLLLKNNLY